MLLSGGDYPSFHFFPGPRVFGPGQIDDDVRIRGDFGRSRQRVGAESLMIFKKTEYRYSFK
jgi:hypothetical protein